MLKARKCGLRLKAWPRLRTACRCSLRSLGGSCRPTCPLLYGLTAIGLPTSPKPSLRVSERVQNSPTAGQGLSWRLMQLSSLAAAAATTAAAAAAGGSCLHWLHRGPVAMQARSLLIVWLAASQATCTLPPGGRPQGRAGAGAACASVLGWIRGPQTAS